MMKLLLCPLLLLTHITFAQKTFDIQGHRGARGLYPENTITGFIEAVKLGVNTIEMDVVVSKDKQLVVSHDPYINPLFCDFLKGQPTDDEAQAVANIYQMTYEQVKLYDCGSRFNPKFPAQKKMFAVKPLLVDVIDSVEKYIAANHLKPVQYNIETKSMPEGDTIFNPRPDEFVTMLYAMLKQKNILSRCIIQSFDVRTLQVLHKLDPKATTALLVENELGFDENIVILGFTPTIYSPYFALVTKEVVEKCHAKKMLIIPWTVNEEPKMLELKSIGVDGIISDYPDIAVKVLR